MLRMPDGLRDQIKRVASRNNRSMNSEIVHAIEVYLKIQETDQMFLNAINNGRDGECSRDEVGHHLATKSDVERLLRAIEGLNRR